MSRTAFALTTAALVIALSPPARAMIFFKIDAIPGDVTTEGYQGQIAVDSLEFSGGQAPPRTGVAKPCAAPSGKTQISAIALQKLSASASVKLFLAAATGTVSSEARISVVVPGDVHVTEIVRYELTDMFVNSLAVVTSGDRPTEALEIRFRELTMKTFAPTVQDARWVVCNTPC